LGPSRPTESIPFASAGGSAQQRYESVRAYALTPANGRPRVSPAQFDLRRFHRFGLLGLVDGQPLRRRWEAADFEVHVIPIGTEDAAERQARLYELLAGLVTTPQGGEDATGCTVRTGLDGAAGEGRNDREPACRDHAVR
jgi:hypothetical protein